MSMLSEAQADAVAWAARTAESRVADAVKSVMGRRVSRREQVERGTRTAAFVYAVQQDDRLQQLRELTDVEARRDSFDTGHLEIADAWSELEGFMLKAGETSKAAVCRERFEREYQLIGADQLVYQDEARRELAAELAEQGITFQP